MENNPTWTPVVALALTDGEGRWLMHKRPEEKHHGGLWEFPGGKVENCETPGNALVREIHEELGIALDPANLEPAGFAQEAEADRQCPIVILLYTCRVWKGEPQALEGGEIGWFSPATIMTLDKSPLDVTLATSLFAKMAD